MTQRIQQLSQQLANQIAAGEVVERPASVIKELIENSLDAGAKVIEIDIERGGLALIKIRDDGYGIEKVDLELALAPHATSKISTLEDLECVASLGFRGEALASISSISRFILSSRTATSEYAWQVATEGKQITLKAQAIAHPVGTSVEVRDLFFNTPVRKKFLRTEKTEFGHVEQLVRRIALSHLTVAIRLSHNQREVLHLRPASNDISLTKRIQQVCGGAFVKSSLHMDFENQGMRISGWLGMSDFSRSQADLQYFYVNGRTVRDRLINHAVRLAYADRLPQGRYPCYVLHLEIDPKVVDVNVHPTKNEVRFRETRMVHDFIASCTQKTLQGGQYAQEEMRNAPMEYNTGTSRPQSPLINKVAEQMGVYQSLYQEDKVTTQKTDSSTELSSVANTFRVRYLACLHKQFILAETEEGLLIIDIAKAKKCLNIESLTQHCLDDALRIQSQPLLIPISQHISEAEVARIEALVSHLMSMGIELQAASPTTIVLRQLPIQMIGFDQEALLRTIIDVAVTMRVLGKDAIIEKLLSALMNVSFHVNDELLKPIASQAFLSDIYKFGLAEMNKRTSVCVNLPIHNLLNSK